jgi:hypothetical protein
MINDALEQKEAAEWEQASTRKRAQIRRRHANGHFGAIRGQPYWLVHDNRRHARSALHGRINASGNNMAATFDAVPYVNAQECPKRVEMNALLRKHRVKWRFRVKKPKTGKPKASPVGNCARKLHTNPELLKGLLEIAYAEELPAAAAQQLDEATEQCEETMGAAVDAEARARRASSSRASRSRLPSSTVAGSSARPDAAAAAAAAAAPTTAAALPPTGAATTAAAAAAPASPVVATAPAAAAEPSLDGMKVAELKAEARRAGCIITGLTKKQELLDALQQFRQQQQEAAAQGPREDQAGAAGAEGAAAPAGAAGDAADVPLTGADTDASGACSSDWESTDGGASEAGETGDEGQDVEDIGAPDAASQDGQTEQIEVVAREEGGVKVGGLATACDVWIASINFQTHRYEKYDDRNRQEAERHGEEGQRLGATWGDALQRHTGDAAQSRTICFISRACT